MDASRREALARTRQRSQILAALATIRLKMHHEQLFQKLRYSRYENTGLRRYKLHRSCSSLPPHRRSAAVTVWIIALKVVKLTAARLHLFLAMAVCPLLRRHRHPFTGGEGLEGVNHIEQTMLQLSREPRKLPVMKINPAVKNIFDFKFEDFTLEGYDPHPGIKAPVAI